MGFQSVKAEIRKTVQKKIIETAHAKFMRHGIRRVTMDEIARELRMSKKTLYQFFSNKEALVLGVTDLITSNMIPAMKEALSGKRPVEERLSSVFEAMSRLPSFVSTEFIRDIEADYPHIWKEIDERRKEVFGRFGEMIEQGIREGAIRSDVHPKVATRVLRAIIDRVLVPEVLSLGEFTTADAVRTMLAIFRGGLLAPEKSARRGRRR